LMLLDLPSIHREWKARPQGARFARPALLLSTT